MGTAFAWPLVDRGHRVRLVGTHLDDAIIDSIRKRGRHPKLDLELPPGIDAYPFTELATGIDGAEALVLGVSSAGVRWAGQQIAPFLREGLPLAMVAKGLEWDGRAPLALAGRAGASRGRRDGARARGHRRAVHRRRARAARAHGGGVCRAFASGRRGVGEACARALLSRVVARRDHRRRAVRGAQECLCHGSFDPRGSVPAKAGPAPAASGCTTPKRRSSRNRCSRCSA